MPLTKLKEYLDNNNIKYITTTHSPMYTFEEVSRYTHLPGKEFVKTILVRVDDKTQSKTWNELMEEFSKKGKEISWENLAKFQKKHGIEIH